MQYVLWRQGAKGVERDISQTAISAGVGLVEWIAVISCLDGVERELPQFPKDKTWANKITLMMILRGKPTLN